MSHRVEQVNELIRAELANMLVRHMPATDHLTTITYVECSPDLRYAKIFISVLPETMSGTALKNLRHANRLFTDGLKKKLKMKFIPKLNWQIDAGERYAAKIDEVFKHLND